MDVSHGDNPQKYMGFYLYPHGRDKPPGGVPYSGATFSPAFLVTFPREAAGRELGFSVAGGADDRGRWKPFYVKSIVPSGIAALLGQLKVGKENRKV